MLSIVADKVSQAVSHLWAPFGGEWGGNVGGVGGTSRPRSVKTYLPDAAIVNLYREGDTLGGHLDDVEADMDQVWGQEYEVEG